MNQDDGLFSRRTLAALILIAAIGLIGMVAMQVFGDDLVPQRGAGANAYSYSAIGHRAAVETLRRGGYNVVVSRYGSAQKAGFSGILILAEPRQEALTHEFLESLGAARNILLILPKWTGRQDETRPGWLKSARPVHPDIVNRVLRYVSNHHDRSIVRRPSAGTVEFAYAEHSAHLTELQLVLPTPTTAVFINGDGALLLEFRRNFGSVWVLSDPDIMNNHGLGKGENAALLDEILFAINPAATALVFDETIHGFERKPSLWYAVLEFPFVVVTFSIAAAILFFVWAMVGRFGAPLPTPSAVTLGKAGLIANTANLLRAGGHSAHVLERYAEATIRDVAERLHCPHGMASTERLRWLDQIGEARGVGERIADLSARADAIVRGRQTTATVAATVRQLYRWKQEMLHGS